MILAFRSLTLAAASLAIAIGATEARDLRIAPAGPPAHPAHYMYEHFATYLDEISGGELTGTIIGPEVVSLGQMKDALQTGLAEVGNFLPLYFPADMPVTSTAGDLALLGRNPHAMAIATTEFIINCEPCQKEFKDLGLVYLGSGSSDVYGLLTTKPVRTADDLKGMRLRSGGAPYSRWAEHFGATPVSMSVLDTFEAMSQGTIDGTMASVVDLLSFRLIDTAKDVTTIPIGTYNVTSNFTIGDNTWSSFTDEERAEIGAAAARANLDLTDRWAYQLPKVAMKAVEETDIEVLEPTPEFLEASETFSAEDSAARVAAGGTEAEKFANLVKKWTTIVDETGTDLDALADRVKSEIWDNVDFSTYGQ